MTVTARQSMVVLDLEGVLTPEIWIALADEFKIDELRRTTKDEPDYDRLMGARIETLTTHDITIDRIHKVIADLTPLPGAKDFLDELRRETQVVLLSDTFEQFIGPLMGQLGQPAILCHHLDIRDGRIVGFRARIDSQKRRSVEAFQSMNYAVIDVGDSFNDLHMIDAADRGFLFMAPEGIRDQRADLTALDTYDELAAALRVASSELLAP